MTAAAFTIPAHKPNEDNFLVDVKLAFFGVFDGVGGARGGFAASKIAARVVAKTFKQQSYKNQKQETVEGLKKALVEATHQITIDGQIYSRFNQGTTATIVKISNSKITIANVGDSRCYGLTKGDELKRLTVDHGILEELLKSRQISLDVALKIDQAKNKKDLTVAELAIFNQRHVITEALAADFERDVHIDFNEVNSKKFKMLVLTTDGVHDNLTDDEIEAVLKKSKTVKVIAKNLVALAFEISKQNLLRSKPDDITAVVVKL